MLLIQCVTAYVVLRELMNKEFDYKTSYAIVTLTRKLKPHVEFYAREENKLIDKYAAKDENGRVKYKGKTWTIENPTMYEQYRSEINSLGAVEVEEFGEPIKVPSTPPIKPAHLDALYGFMEFGG